MIEAHTADELVDALTEVWSDGDDVARARRRLEPLRRRRAVRRHRRARAHQGIERLPSPRPRLARLRVQAGHDWDALVAYAVEHGLAGIEAMSGIPGHGAARPPCRTSARTARRSCRPSSRSNSSTRDRSSPSTVPAAELGLGFRTSALKHHYGSAPRRPAVILSVTLELAEVGHAERPIGGAQLRTALGLAQGETVSVSWIRDHVLETRRRKGMVLDDADHDTYSAGSFFQNAVVSASFARTLPDECPRWPVAPDLDPVLVIPLASWDGFVPPPTAQQTDVKVSAGWLIEHAGVRKGFHLPRSRAALSTKHALASTNRGDATAEELAELGRFIQGRVQAEFGLILQPEPVLIGVEL